MKQVVSYGAGTNSTAMVCEMVRRGEQIDAIVFADTGGERPETYRHVDEFSAWLTQHGYPFVVTVRQREIMATMRAAKERKRLMGDPDERLRKSMPRTISPRAL